MQKFYSIDKKDNESASDKESGAENEKVANKFYDEHGNFQWNAN